MTSIFKIRFCIERGDWLEDGEVFPELLLVAGGRRDCTIVDLLLWWSADITRLVHQGEPADGFWLLVVGLVFSGQPGADFANRESFHETRISPGLSRIWDV